MWHVGVVQHIRKWESRDKTDLKQNTGFPPAREWQVGHGNDKVGVGMTAISNVFFDYF